MKKKFDFDKELEKLDEDELQSPQIERAKIIMTVIPFALIIVILAVSLLVNHFKNNKQSTNDLQESIKEYADTGFEDRAEDNTDIPKEDNADTLKEDTKPEPAYTKEDKKDTAQAEETPTPYKEIMQPGEKDYSQISFQAEEQLKEMMGYWSVNNQKALRDLAYLDRFKAMSLKLSGTTDFYYAGETNAEGKPHGTGIAVYADNQYYYGEWQNGLRNGNGTWMHYHIHETPDKTDLYTYHQYTGSWKNDLPDGEGSEHYDYNMELLQENTGYNNNLIGSYAKGLIHGEFYITNIYRDEEVFEWYATAENGSWVYKSENRDEKGRGPVQVEDRNPDNYIWMHPKDNKNIGVSCLLSSQKN